MQQIQREQQRKSEDAPALNARVATTWRVVRKAVSDCSTARSDRTGQVFIKFYAQLKGGCLRVAGQLSWERLTEQMERYYAAVLLAEQAETA
jgi:hypothetical protein